MADKYTISISKGSFWDTLFLLLTGAFTCWQMRYYVLPELNHIFYQSISYQDIGLIWPPIIGYVLLALCLYIAIKIFRSPTSKGFSEALTIGGIGIGFVGLIIGLIIGLFFWLIAGVDNFSPAPFPLPGSHIPLASLLTGGIIRGWAVGLIIGLVFGSYIGLREEFRKESEQRVSN